MSDSVTIERTKSVTRLSTVLSSGRKVEVEVFHWEGEDPVVNWAGIGSVSPEDAVDYAVLINHAAIEAFERRNLAAGLTKHGEKR